MQEFSTVSASSYDQASLAAKLTEKSAEGWQVVSIITTGGDVTAFLSRDAGGAAHDTSVVAATTGSAESRVPSDTASSAAANDVSAHAPATEPAGWGSSPAASPDTSSPGTSSPGTSSAAASSTPAYRSDGSSAPTGGHDGGGSSSYGSSSTGASHPSSDGPTMAPIADSQPSYSQQVAAAAPAPASQPTYTPAAAPAVPAGWYADPAGRFDLRYWDGGTWTEHVSRAGQQYTDPPVA